MPQELVVYLIVALAAGYVIAKAVASVRAKADGDCGGCGSCPASKRQAPPADLIQIDAAPPRRD